MNDNRTTVVNTYANQRAATVVSHESFARGASVHTTMMSIPAQELAKAPTTPIDEHLPPPAARETGKALPEGVRTDLPMDQGRPGMMKPEPRAGAEHPAVVAQQPSGQINTPARPAVPETERPTMSGAMPPRRPALPSWNEPFHTPQGQAQERPHEMPQGHDNEKAAMHPSDARPAETPQPQVARLPHANIPHPSQPAPIAPTPMGWKREQAPAHAEPDTGNKPEVSPKPGERHETRSQEPTHEGNRRGDEH